MNGRSLAICSILLLSSLVGCGNVDVAAKDDPERFMAISRSYDAGEMRAALVEAKQYVKDYPESHLGWNLLGWIYSKSDKLEEAIRCFDKALKIDPKWDNAHVGKGTVFQKMGDNDKARAAYLKAIEITPDNAEAFSSLAVVELVEGNDKQAVEYGEKAWALRTDLATIPANLSVAYHYLGDHAKRDAYYKEAEKLGYPNLKGLQDIFSGKTSLR